MNVVLYNSTIMFVEGSHLASFNVWLFLYLLMSAVYLYHQTIMNTMGNSVITESYCYIIKRATELLIQMQNMPDVVNKKLHTKLHNYTADEVELCAKRFYHHGAKDKNKEC